MHRWLTVALAILGMTPLAAGAGEARGLDVYFIDAEGGAATLIVRHPDPTSGLDARIIAPLASGDTTLYRVCPEFPGTSLPAVPEIFVARLPMPPGFAPKRKPGG